LEITSENFNSIQSSIIPLAIFLIPCLNSGNKMLIRLIIFPLSFDALCGQNLSFFAIEGTFADKLQALNRTIIKQFSLVCEESDPDGIYELVTGAEFRGPVFVVGRIQLLFNLVGPVLAVAENGLQTVHSDISVVVFFRKHEAAQEKTGRSVLALVPVTPKTFFNHQSLSS
jgi:hypothetical protein